MSRSLVGLSLSKNLNRIFQLDDQGELVRKALVKEVSTVPIPSMITEPMDVDEQYPEQVEEYTDDQGRRVRRVLRKTVVRTTATGVGSEQPEGSEEPEERIEEYTDEQGRQVRRIIKRVVKHTRVEKEVEPLSKSSLEFQPFKLQFKPKGDAKASSSPDEVQEFVDDQGRRVQRIVRKTVVGPLVLPEQNGEGVTEKTEEFVDQDGRKVVRVTRRRVVTRSGEVPEEEKVQIVFKVAKCN